MNSGALGQNRVGANSIEHRPMFIEFCSTVILGFGKALSQSRLLHENALGIGRFSDGYG
jgi:hypothetical protein